MTTTATVTDLRSGNSASFEVPDSERSGQLSMRVEGEAVGRHVFGSLAIGGALPIDRDLNLEDEVRIQVVDSLGEVIAAAPAMVGAPNFKTHRDKEGEIIAIERAHKARIG